MKRKSAVAAGFKGRWRIAEMDMLASDDLDLAEPAHISFSGTAGGDMAFGASAPRLMCATARVTALPAPSLRGKASMKAIPSAAAAGPPWGLPDASSATSSFTMATTRASSPSASEFFSSLLV